MDRYERAKRGLNLVNAYFDGVMKGVQQQMIDVKAIAKQALDDKKYPADKLVPDMLALWFNAAAAARDAFLGGRPVSQGDDAEEGDDDEGGSGPSS